MLIEARNLHKRYVLKKHELHVLRGVDLVVKAGETTAVVGRSGAGKSTLLHILGAIDRPDAGEVCLDGEDIYRLPSSRRSRIRGTDIGFVFQTYHLLNEMDVLENVVLPARALGRGGSAVRDQGMALLEAVGVGDRARHTPLELSGGEQQRVALARALINNPDLILADEPTGNLDEKTGRQVLDYMFELTQANGRSLVMVTHNERIAHSCDRVLNLVDGKLITLA